MCVRGETLIISSKLKVTNESSSSSVVVLFILRSMFTLKRSWKKPSNITMMMQRERRSAWKRRRNRRHYSMCGVFPLKYFWIIFSYVMNTFQKCLGQICLAFFNSHARVLFFLNMYSHLLRLRPNKRSLYFGVRRRTVCCGFCNLFSEQYEFSLWNLDF